MTNHRVRCWHQRGRSPERCPLVFQEVKLPFALRWTARLSGAIVAEAAACEGIAYVATYRRLYAVDLRSGSTVWEFLPRNTRVAEESSTNKATPAVLGDRIFYADFSGIIYCLDRRSGEVLWKNDRIGASDDSLLVWKDRLFCKIARTPSNRLTPRNGYACLSVSGELLWSVASEGRVFTECAALDGETVIFGDGKGFAYGVRVVDGGLKWRFDAKDHVVVENWVGTRKVSVHGAPFVVEAKVVMRAGSGRDLICLESQSGELLWHYHAPAPVENIACGRDFLYHTSVGGQLFAVSTRTGELAWSQRNDEHDLGDTVAHGGLVAGGLYICGFNSSHKLAAFSTEDRTVRWTFKKKGRGGFGATPIFVEGKLLVGADYGELFCFEPAA